MRDEFMLVPELKCGHFGLPIIRVTCDQCKKSTEVSFLPDPSMKIKDQVTEELQSKGWLIKLKKHDFCSRECLRKWWKKEVNK